MTRFITRIATYGLAIAALVIASAAVGRAAVGSHWETVESMSVARAYHASAVSGGKWYVGGGISATSAALGQGLEMFAPSVESFDPMTGHWQVVGSFDQGREYLAAASDPTTSRVLFVGGFLPAGPTSYQPLADSYLGNADGWLTGDLSAARYFHAVAFVMGGFLATGGSGSTPQGYSVLLADAERLDPASGQWIPAAPMPGVGRQAHSLTALADGRRAIAIGGCASSGSLRDVDIYDGATDSWAVAATLLEPRCRAASVLLGDGRVLVVGAMSGATVLASAEVYDPVLDQWTPVAPMKNARYDHALATLPDGKVMAVGGTNNATQGEFGALRSTEIYDPVLNAWSDGPDMQDARRWPTVAVLADGVYVTGGANGSGQPSTKDSAGTGASSVEILASTERLALLDTDGGDIGNDASVTPDSMSQPDQGSGGGGGGCSCAFSSAPVCDMTSEGVLLILAPVLCLGRPARTRRRS